MDGSTDRLADDEHGLSQRYMQPYLKITVERSTKNLDCIKKAIFLDPTLSNDEKNEVTETKKGSEKEEAIKATTVASPNQAQKTTGGRKRKSGSALAPVNSNRGAKVLKTATAAATGTRVAAAKIITGSPGSPVAKIAIAGNNLVSLASLTQPLPPHVVLPTSPIGNLQL